MKMVTTVWKLKHYNYFKEGIASKSYNGYLFINQLFLCLLATRFWPTVVSLLLKYFVGVYILYLGMCVHNDCVH